MDDDSGDEGNDELTCVCVSSGMKTTHKLVRKQYKETTVVVHSQQKDNSGLAETTS